MSYSKFLWSQKLKTAAVQFMAVIMALSLSGCIFLPQDKAVDGPSLVKAGKVTYKTEPVRREDIEERLQCYGVFVHVNQYDLYFDGISGIVEKLYIGPGDRIKKGDVIAELNTESLQKQIKQQKMALQIAVEAYSRTKSDGQKSITKAKTRISRLNEELAALKKVSGTSSSAEIDNIKSQIDEQEVNLRLLVETYGTGGNNPGIALKQAQNRIDELTFYLNQLELQNTNSRLISNVSGIVINTGRVSEKEYVSANQIVAQVADISELQLQYSGDKISKFTTGTKVDVRLDRKGEQKVLTGEVISVPRPPNYDYENIKKFIRVKVEGLPDDAEPGDNAYISLLLQKSEDAVVVPATAIYGFEGHEYVYVIKDGVKTERGITVGIRTRTKVEIIEGLDEGENVLVR